MNRRAQAGVGWGNPILPMSSFAMRSEIPVSPEDFWSGMSLEAVNAELAPLVRMTAPAAFRTLPMTDWPTGQPLFTSTILLLGVLPADRHAFCLDAVDPGRGFLERSSTTMLRLWQHERTTAPTAHGCIVEDAVTFRSRVPGLDRLLLPVYRAVFRHRHDRLTARYGAIG